MRLYIFLSNSPKMGICPSLLSYTEQQELNKQSQTMEQTNQIVTSFTIRLDDIQNGIKKKTAQQLDIMNDCRKLAREASKRKDADESKYYFKRYKIMEKTRKAEFDRLLMLESIKLQLGHNTNHVQLMQWVAGVVKMTLGNNGNKEEQNKVLESLDETMIGKESVDFFQQQLQESFSRLSEPNTSTNLIGEPDEDELMAELNQFLEEPDTRTLTMPQIPTTLPFSPMTRSMNNEPQISNNNNNNNDDDDEPSNSSVMVDELSTNVFSNTIKTRTSTGRKLLDG